MLFPCRPVSVYNVRKSHHLGNAAAFGIQLAVCWIGWVSLIIAQIVHNTYPTTVKLGGIYSLAWVFYLGFATILTVQRAQIRGIHGINGNVIEDFFAALILYPCVTTQLETVNKPGGTCPIMPDNPNVTPEQVVTNFYRQESKA